MNVVENDALEVEREGSILQDGGASRRSGARSVGGLPVPRVNRLPELRDRTQLSRIDLKRYLSESSRELQAFVAPLEEQIRRHTKYRGQKHRASLRAQSKVADLVLEVIRQLAYRETGVFNLEAPVPQLLSTLFAGSVEVGIVNGLARRAHKALVLRDAHDHGSLREGAIPPASRGLAYDIARELDELVMLLTWYVRRKMSLCALQLESDDDCSPIDVEGAPLNGARDQIFGLDVMHDHQVFGVKGCLLTCGLRLLGRDGEALWLRVALMSDGQPVAARSEWASWTDPGGDGPIELLPEEGIFCSLVPIRPNSQRLVIDEVRAFVPYAALKLPTGRSQVEIVVTVIDSEGRQILGVSQAENICVPPRQLGLSAVPAPHSLGMWPHDVVSGDKLSDLTVSSGYKLIAGWERHSISVAFDLSLFMHAGESVMLECRFINAQGSIVELSSLGMPFVATELNVAVESVSSYRYRRVLHPRGAWALYQGLCIDIPVDFLLLSPGVHEITCELVVVSADDRVLCGDMSRVNVHVPERDRQVADANGAAITERRTAASHRAMGDVHIELESFEIDPAWLHGGDDCIRVQARFAPRNHAQQLANLATGRVGELFSPYRVEIALEREDGHVLLQAYSDSLGMSFRPVTRAVCVDPYSAHVEQSVVANFRREEVLGWSFEKESGRAVAKHRIFARVTALSLMGDVLVSETKEFFVKALGAGAGQVVYVREPAPTIVDVEAVASPQGERIASRVVINVQSGDQGFDEMRVQLALCSPRGTSKVIATRDLQVQHRGAWTRQVAGLCQYAIASDYRVQAATIGAGWVVEASLITKDGDLLHRMQQPIRVAGVLSEADENAADFDSDLADSGRNAESAFRVVADPGNGANSKGLWGRLFGR
jgi:hypothetical protein